MHFPSQDNNYLHQHVTLLMNSYRKLLGEELLVFEPNTADNRAKGIFNAPFAVLSHTTDADPLFNYANKTALALFDFEWDELIGLPSRLSAEPVCQTERDLLLKQVSENGFIKNYQGVRLTKSGRRFLIKNAVVWNLLGDGNVYSGQAACIKEWSFL